MAASPFCSNWLASKSCLRLTGSVGPLSRTCASSSDTCRSISTRSGGGDSASSGRVATKVAIAKIAASSRVRVLIETEFLLNRSRFSSSRRLDNDAAVERWAATRLTCRRLADGARPSAERPRHRLRQQSPAEAQIIPDAQSIETNCARECAARERPIALAERAQPYIAEDAPRRATAGEHMVMRRHAVALAHHLLEDDARLLLPSVGLERLREQREAPYRKRLREV